jgi:hypothetical protein
LKSLNFFDINNSEWVILREVLLNNINIDESWKNYLRNSGSMIEYYQMYLAYQNIEIYEKENNLTYDYILRFRTDTIFKDTINFNIKIYDENYIKDLLYKIKDKMNYENIYSYESIVTFMNIIHNEKRLEYKNLNCIEHNLPKNLLEIKNIDELVKCILNYIKSSNYLIALRENVIYFANRETFKKINILGITYGCYKQENNDYWFNSESQLKKICTENNIDYYSSCTNLEGLSLYEYVYENYFDENNSLINSSYSFFIKRR